MEPPFDLSSLTPEQRAEAEAAAAAAERAERRAEERARQRKAAAAAADGGGPSSDPPAPAPVDDDEEERRALADAMERRARERRLEAEREGRSSMQASVAIAAPIAAPTAGGGVTFVSRKKRGAAQISQSASAEDGEGKGQQSLDSVGLLNGGRGGSKDGDAAATRGESHLSASQLASIKRAYLGDKAAADAAGSSSNGPGSRRGGGGTQHANTAQSVRQRLREQRQKRRVKKTTFKFEWGDDEDTFDDDDPLHPSYVPANRAGGGGGRRTNGAPSPSGRRGGNHNNNNKSSSGAGGKDLDAAGLGFGRRTGIKSKYDSVSTVHTVATKPLSRMTPRDWRIFRENYNIVVRGGKSPPPLRSFDEAPVGMKPIHPSLIDAIKNRLRYTSPSPIQRQAIPIGMQRRDLIGIAETGSGKTAAFSVPLCHHVLCFPKSILDTVAEEGPLAIVMAPTRELALQINVEFGKLLSSQRDVKSLAVVGGQSITEQATRLREGIHVVVGTPGRINDCVEMAYLVLNQCSYIVLDEADRMIDLGFAPQIEQILDAMGGTLKSEDETEAYRQEREDLEKLGKAVPAHRLTAMFSATMPAEVVRIAKRYLRHPVVVSVGDRDTRKNSRIVQRVLYLSSPAQKEGALRDLLRRTGHQDKVIVFVNEKKNAEGVSRIVESSGKRSVVLHGGKGQDEREENLGSFRRGGVVLVATDVAGRGIDIPDVSQVINYDLPTRSIDNYCHRIGRTGRAGKEGLATSFMTDEDEGIMAPLKMYLESTGMPVPDKLARNPAAVGRNGGNII